MFNRYLLRLLHLRAEIERFVASRVDIHVGVRVGFGLRPLGVLTARRDLLDRHVRQIVVFHV